jgi:catechol 2,3-dioxygenase-like lactoylglutathione lyase family enzyme
MTAHLTPRIALIGLVVTDMAASLAFYRRLGLDLPAGADTQPHTETTLPGGLRMAWDTVETIRSFDPDWAPATGSRLSLAFECGSPEAVDAAYAELTEAGHPGHLKPWDAFWGQRYAVVLDPDGNAVDLFAATATETASAAAPEGPTAG